MKKWFAVAVDSSQSEDDRVEALEQLEDLVEQKIDFANNLKVLKMWEPLHSLLTSDTCTLAVKIQTLSVIATAMQNNPSGQDAYFAYNPFPTLISFLVPSPSSTVESRSKAVYALSGLLKHNAPAVSLFGSPEVDGWTKLRDLLQDPEIKVRRKTIFLFNMLLMSTTPSDSNPEFSSQQNFHTPSSPPAGETQQNQIHPNSHAVLLQNPWRVVTSQPTLDAFKEHGIVSAVIEALTNPQPCGEDGDGDASDLQVEQFAVRLLYSYTVICSAELSEADKEALRSWFEEKTKEGVQGMLAKELDLTVGELKSLVGKLE